MWIILLALGIFYLFLKGNNLMTTQQPQQGTQNTSSGVKLPSTQDTIFQKAYKLIRNSEGGYTVDSGGPTNFGVTQTTYDAWRRAHKIPTQPIKKISQQEVEAIYYNNYWIPSGAVNVPTFPLAYIVFDTAINHGDSVAKSLLAQCGGSPTKYLQLRLATYKQDKNWNIYGQGWSNRIAYVARNAGVTV